VGLFVLGAKCHGGTLTANGSPMSLEQELQDVIERRSALIAQRSQTTGHPAADIQLALEDLGYLKKKPGLKPEEFDPDGQLQQLEYKMRELQKVLAESDEK